MLNVVFSSKSRRGPETAYEVGIVSALVRLLVQLSILAAFVYNFAVHSGSTIVELIAGLFASIVCIVALVAEVSWSGRARHSSRYELLQDAAFLVGACFFSLALILTAFTCEALYL